MKGRKTSRWHTILFTVCVCFFIGAIIGAFSAATTETEQIQKLGEYSGGFLADAGFRNLFIKHGIYIGNLAFGIYIFGSCYSNNYYFCQRNILWIFFNYSSYKKRNKRRVIGHISAKFHSYTALYIDSCMDDEFCTGQVYLLRS